MNVEKSKYKESGVDVDRGGELIEKIKHFVSKTDNRGVVGGLGGFGAIFDASVFNYKDPLFVSGADGVGTKIMLTIEMNKYDAIGIDLVAMCANDVLVQGASPIFFLDYFACGKLNTSVAEIVIGGIAKGCKIAGCALIGGETAEMPDMYTDEKYDLAGFCVGIVERDSVIDGSDITEGDVLIALGSSGPHSNGYSLIRKIIKDSGESLNNTFDSKNNVSLGDALLTPTKIYVNSVKELLKICDVKALCHITGGGLTENLPRVIPDHFQATVHTNTWELPEIFLWLKEKGNIELNEMYRTFNCGIGMIVCVSKEDRDKALNCLKSCGEIAWEVGKIEERQGKTNLVNFTDSY